MKPWWVEFSDGRCFLMDEASEGGPWGELNHTIGLFLGLDQPWTWCSIDFMYLCANFEAQPARSVKAWLWYSLQGSPL